MSQNNYLHCIDDDRYYETVLVPMDGSCLFHSFSYALFGHYLFTQDLRISVCDYEIDNREWLLDSDYTEDLNMEAFLHRVHELRRPDEYATFVDVYCMSVIYEAEVIIYYPVSTSATEIKIIAKINRDVPVNTVKLLYVNNNHYMPLIDRGTDTGILNDIGNVYEEENDSENFNFQDYSLNNEIIINDLQDAMSGNANENVLNRPITIEIEHSYAWKSVIENNAIEDEHSYTMKSSIENTVIENDHSYAMNNLFENNKQSLNSVEANVNRYIGRQVYLEANLRTHNLGAMNLTCDFCKAYYFRVEATKDDKAFTKCCMRGKYIFDFNFEIPDLIKKLVSNAHPESKNFRNNIRQFNSALAFASFGASVSAGNVSTLSGRGPYCFKVQGVIQHLSSNLRENNPTKIKYSQLYFVDSSLANQCRQNRNQNCSESLLKDLDELIRAINPYAKTFLTLRELERQEMARCFGDPTKSINYSIWLLKHVSDNKGIYNLPNCDEVAAIFSSNGDGCPPYLRDIEIHSRNGRSINLKIDSQHTDPMSYPILYPFGKGGWSHSLEGKDVENVNNENEDVGPPKKKRRRTVLNKKKVIEENTLVPKEKRKTKVTLLNYYSYLLSVRLLFSIFLHAGKLTQQYVVDAYCKVEAERLNYLRCNQRALRVEQYTGLHDFLRARTEANKNFRIGKAVILPSSFPGSPRHMAQNYQDAMSMVSRYGKPDLFVTFTCNAKWPEIVENLESYESASDRPDLVARVFQNKLSALLDQLTVKHVLGKVKAFTYVVEWQKRGLPHAHILLILNNESKIRTPDDIDTVVSAEIPDQENEKKLFNIIKSCMIHGPCGKANPRSPCMEKNKCTKNYPKPFCEKTIFNIDGFPRYRRRNNGRKIIIERTNGRAVEIDNTNIVPYNKYLSLTFNSHINVEVCASIKVVKYLFKYIYKGHSCIRACVNLEEEKKINYDEIDGYLNARYVGPCESFHRIYAYPLHGCSHAIKRLPIHLENMQDIFFTEGQEEETMAREAVRATQLTEWFKLNSRDPEARKYLYHQIPEHYTWDKKNKRWKKKGTLRKPMIGRLFNVDARAGERFYLRLLLLHRPGVTSFEDMRTIEGIIYNSYREAARAMDLLSDDSTWHSTMSEAEGYQMPYQLRQLFVVICIFCEPSNPIDLWEKHIDGMIEDFLHQGLSREVSINNALYKINELLNIHGKSNLDFHIPMPDMSLIICNENNMQINQSTIEQYDSRAELEKANESILQLNREQFHIFKCIMNKLYPHESEWQGENYIFTNKNLFFVDAAAGTGKTFLYSTLIASIRGREDIAVAYAFSGNAASQFLGGRTLHSAFKIPLNLNETSVCGLKCTHKYSEHIKNAKLIIIDEVSMCPSLVLNIINKYLKELMNNNSPYGGKIILFGGDFMQTLPIVKHGNRVQIVSVMAKRSEDWNLVHKFELLRNMRVRDHAYNFALWILKIGKGILTAEQNLHDDWINLPPECVVSQNELVLSIFGEKLSQNQFNIYKDKAILAPTNEETFELNEQVLEILEGQSKIYYSHDSILEDEDSNNFAEVSIEFLNSVTPSGMPPHQLKLKCGAIVMLLRNLNTRDGLCNGTRLLITEMKPHVLRTTILTGANIGKEVFIPRIIFQPATSDLPFVLRREQFPVRLAFAMTINKAQGQTLEKVGILLKHHVFSHGQLYVALSRARCFEDIKIALANNSTLTKNIIFPEVFNN